MKPMRYVELFCGVGGFRLGLEPLGMECVLANDVNASACEVYRSRFGDVLEGDVRSLDANKVPDHDLLTAGFPCQSFSHAGKNLGMADERGNLFFDVHRVLKAKRPPFFLIENVRGLLTNDKGRTIRIMLEMLNGLGYRCDVALLDASSFGVAQRRVRAFLVGVTRDIFPMTANPAERNLLASRLPGLIPVVPQHDPIQGDLSGLRPSTRIDVPDKLLGVLRERIAKKPRRMLRIRDNRLGSGSIPTWKVSLFGDVSERQEKILDDVRRRNQEHVWSLIDKKGEEGSCIARFSARQLKATKAELDQLSEMGYLRKSGDKYNLINRTIIPGSLPSCYAGPKGTAPTTTASNMSGMGLVLEDGVYALGAKEYEQIQGFPVGHTAIEGLSEKERVRLIGNSVVPPVIEWLGRVIKRVMEES